MKKKTVLSLLLFSLMLLLPFSAVNAKSSEVTGRMRKDPGIREITRQMTTYTTAMERSVCPKKGMVKLNADNILSIAAIVRFNRVSDDTFSKKELQSEINSLFGKKMKVGITTLKVKKVKNRYVVKGLAYQ